MVYNFAIFRFLIISSIKLTSIRLVRERTSIKTLFTWSTSCFSILLESQTLRYVLFLKDGFCSMPLSCYTEKIIREWFWFVMTLWVMLYILAFKDIEATTATVVNNGFMVIIVRLTIFIWIAERMWIKPYKKNVDAHEITPK